MNNSTIIITLSLLFIATLPKTFAQTTSEVHIKTSGIQFTIPEEWIGQEVNGGSFVGYFGRYILQVVPVTIGIPK